MLAGLIIAAAVARIPAAIRGDLNHDGKPDVAEIAPGPRSGYRLIVHREAVGHPVSVVITLTHNTLPDYLTTSKPGRWQTWCGKGGGNDGDPCPRSSIPERVDDNETSCLRD